MKTNLKHDFQVDKQQKQIHVTREFDAPRQMVWEAWTTAELLDQWWAPRPWKAETQHMDFREGGYWLYAMVSPEGERHYSRVDYQKITQPEAFSTIDGFCDENGSINPDFPQNKWDNRFEANESRTTVKVTLSFDAVEDLEQIIKMGFKEGFISALSNLDHYLETQFNSGNGTTKQHKK